MQSRIVRSFIGVQFRTFFFSERNKTYKYMVTSFPIHERSYSPTAVHTSSFKSVKLVWSFKKFFILILKFYFEMSSIDGNEIGENTNEINLNATATSQFVWNSFEGVTENIERLKYGFAKKNKWAAGREDAEYAAVGEDTAVRNGGRQKGWGNRKNEESGVLKP